MYLLYYIYFIMEERQREKEREIINICLQTLLCIFVPNLREIHDLHFLDTPEYLP